MSLDQWIVTIAIGVSFGLLLFLLASGFTLTFGLARFVNLAHGAVFLVAAYVATAVAGPGWRYLLAIGAAAATGVVLSVAIYLVAQLRWSRLGADELSQAFTSDGLIVRYRADGSEAQRVPLDPGARKAPGPDDAVLLSDGRLLVARAGADTAVVSPSGEVSSIPNSACPDPLGLYAAGRRAVLLACRSGNVLRIE